MQDSIRIEPLTPHIGAIIHGVDLSKDLSNSQFDAIHGALMKHSAIFFRNQDLSDPVAYKNFASRFGVMYDEHPAANGAVAHPEIMKLHHDHNSKFVAGSGWHSDLSSDEEPPMGTMLWNHIVPPEGGDTLFASMYAAYDALSDRMKSYLEGLTALHDAEPVFRPITPDWNKRFTQAVHPMVRTHPVTGRKALFVDPTYTARIREVSKAESAGILNFLWKHIENPTFHCRFKWEERSLAFWDNRCTMHMALWDYFPQVRSGDRITLKGDKPF